MKRVYMWLNAILICGILVLSNYIVDNNLLTKGIWLDVFEMMWAIVGWCCYWFYTTIKSGKK